MSAKPGMSSLKAILALSSLAGLLLVGAPAAIAHGRTDFYVGPGRAQIYYENGSYYDRHRHRHTYRYPSDWRNYGHDRSWYRSHSNWYRPDDRDWYRDRHW